MRVDVRLVGDVVALPLEEADERHLPDDRPLPARCERAVEGDAVRGCAAGRVHVVEALAAPVVVRLPGVHRDLDEDRGAARRRRADDEEDGRSLAALRPARQEEVRDVVPADGVARQLELVRDRPAGDGLAVPVGARMGLRGPLLVGAAAGNAADEAAARAAVPAHAVHLDAVAGRRRGRHVEVQRLAGQEAQLRRVALDARRGRLLREPGRRSRKRVLGLHRIRGPGGLCARAEREGEPEESCGSAHRRRIGRDPGGRAG